MEDSLARNLYSSIETLELSNLEIGSVPIAHSFQTDSNDVDGDDLWCKDGYSNDGSIEGLDKASDLDREWQRRHGQFHTIGYRDGLMAGKEATAQEGFNMGFKQSILVGYNWGLVRGVTSALNCLPDDFKNKLVETPEKREKFQKLYESVHSVSTRDALNMFHDDILTSESEQLNNHSEGNFDVATTSNQTSVHSHLERYFGELESLLETSAIKVHAAVNPR